MNHALKSAPTLFGIYLLGMLCLPIASFETVRNLPDPSVPVLGNALAFENPWNRGMILGACCCFVALIGVFVTQAWRRIPRSWTVWDAWFVLWVLTPIVCGAFNASPFWEDGFQSLYLAVVWGGPYLAGRVIFGGEDTSKRGLWLILVLGSFTLIPAMLEMIFGRFVYASLYGYHPFQDIGERKWFGSRPLLCFEDPNQAAICWMTIAFASVPLISSWFAPSKWVAWKWGVLATPFLFQGVGAAILTLIGVTADRARVFRFWKLGLIGFVVVGIICFVARGPILRVGRELAQQAGVEDVVRGVLKDGPFGSFTWRLAREEQGSSLWQKNPIAGTGTVMFWRDAGHTERPWGLFSLVTGAYGIIGCIILLSFVFAPCAVSFYRSYGPASSEGFQVAKGVAILIALHGIDAMMNSAFFLPMLWVYGAWVGTHVRTTNA